VIRQAISCDICGAEKKQTNHWFVAFDQAGELRVSGWSSRNRLRPGTRHLCGQTCLHKLVDEFVARTINSRVQAATDAPESEIPIATDTSLTSRAAYRESERFVRTPLVTTPAVAPTRPMPVVSTGLVALPARVVVDEPRQVVSQPSSDGAPNYASRHWRAEAWERERERELRAVERKPSIMGRRRKSS
jgi:hypothetical protein